MPLMDEDPGDAARARVQVFIRAPGREIDVPIVKLQVEISGGVCAVETDDAFFPMAGLRDRTHVERLAGVVIDPAQKNQRNAVAFTIDRFEDVLGPQRGFAVSRSKLDKRVRTTCVSGWCGARGRINVR